MRRLSAYPFKEKEEIIDFSRIPPGRYEMNFRPPSEHPIGDIRKPIIWMWIASLLGIGGIFLLQYFVGPFLYSITAACVAVCFGVILALGSLLFGWRPFGSDLLTANNWIIAIVLCAIPPVVWLLAIVFSRLETIIGAYLLLACVAVPMLLRVADMIVTHAVHWMSANPRIDNQTMRRWRAEWRQRFRGFPIRANNDRQRTQQQRETLQQIRELRNRYPYGFWHVVLAVVVPTVVVVGLWAWKDGGSLGLAIVFCQLVALFFAACYRTIQDRSALHIFFATVAHWFSYGDGRIYPPWVFRSPSGDIGRRVSIATFAVILLAMSIVPLGMVDHLSPTTTMKGDGAFGVLAYQWEVLYRAHLAPAVEALFAGRLMPSLLLLIMLAVATAVPVLYFLLVTYIVAAPALLAHHRALEQPGAAEQHADWTTQAGYAHRLAHSDNLHERNSIIMGYHAETQIPILLDIDLLQEHMHVIGSTGSGKTALGLSNIVTQLIRRGDGPVIVIDCKGDSALFHTTRIEAIREGRRFKWFTNRLHRSTYVFNPFDQKHLEGMTLPEYVGLFMMSLNLHHGDDYGRGWYSAASRRLFQQALETLMSRGRKQQSPISSFSELDETIKKLASDDQEYRAAMHLAFIVQSLSQFRQLNMSPRADGNHPAIEHAIHMPDVISERQVAYFSLVGATDVASVAQIAKLVVFSALSAAISHREIYGERPRVYLICDEAQTIIAQNIQNVLAQAREHGLACVLAHQTMSQLQPPGGPDLSELVFNCTCTKQMFDVRDTQSRKIISAMSGQVGYFDPSWKQLFSDVMAGRVTLGRAAAYPGYEPVVGIRQSIGPRLTEEDIADAGRSPNQSIVSIERNQGCSAYIGAFPIHTDWPISKEEYDHRNLDLPWPEGTEATIELAPFWPADTEETIVPTHHPPLEAPGESPKAVERLKDIKRRLEME